MNIFLKYLTTTLSTWMSHWTYKLFLLLSQYKLGWLQFSPSINGWTSLWTYRVSLRNSSECSIFKAYTHFGKCCQLHTWPLKWVLTILWGGCSRCPRLAGERTEAQDYTAGKRERQGSHPEPRAFPTPVPASQRRSVSPGSQGRV